MAGFTGLTKLAMASAKPNATLTPAGFSNADTLSGKLDVTFGSIERGPSYLLIYGAACPPEAAWSPRL